jgi:tRNA(Ile)-lysidine synthase
VQDIIEKFEATIRRHNLLPDRGCVVMAVSGGPDSLALLHLMREVRDRSHPRLALHVGHLHHGMRGAAADEDAQFVASEAARLGVACTIERTDVPALAAERRLGIEVAGREARYEFLTRLAKSLGARDIAFGHQADDQAETVLMRVMRGAGQRGMGGIPYVRPVADAPGIRVVRPLLDCSRREIVQFLRRRGLRSRLDSTNLSRKYLRNRLRRLAIPEMKRDWGGRLTPDLCSLAALAQRFQARSDAIRAALQSQNSVRVTNGYVETESAWLRRIPPAMLPDLVQAWMKEADLWRKMLSAGEYERIAALLARGRGRVALSGAVLACVWRRLFILCPAPAAARDRRSPERSRRAGSSEMEYRVQLNVPGRTRIEPLGGIIEAEILEAGKELIARNRATRDGFEEFLDMENVELPLVVRFPRPGDRMRPLGAPGSRKLQDIFTDLHVPPWLRTRTLLVTVEDRPIWIVGRRIADAVKLTDGTRKVLRLKFVPKG